MTPQPLTDGEPVRLRDGRLMVVRPVRPADRERLRDEFAHLGERSRRLRFLSAIKQLSERELTYLSDIDHHAHEALIATTPDGRQGVGLARYVRSPGDPRRAELAIEVIDDWLGCGAGRELLGRLAARARADGIDSFTAYCSADNHAILKLLAHLGTSRIRYDGPGTVMVRTSLGRGSEEKRHAA